MSMKLFYITRIRMPTEKAHGLQIAKMCEAYTQLGHDIELIVPLRKNHITDDAFTYYGLTERFPITYIRIPDTIRFSKWVPFLAYWTQAILFLRALTARSIPRDGIVLTRSFDVAWWYTRKGYTVVCEVHDWPRRHKWFAKFLLRKVPFIVSNSVGMSRELAIHGFTNTLVAPNGVDIESLTPTRSREAIREEWGIEKNEFLVLYIGALEAWKGYATLLEASKKMPDVTVGIVGGKEQQLESLRKEYPNVRFFGTQPYREIGNLQNIADVLVIPNDPHFKEDQAYTSPIKLFAHLTSGVPIVVTDLPTIRDVVGDDAVNFFDGSVDSLVREISTVQNNVELAHNKALQAQGLAREHTWTKRAERIIQHATGAQK